MKTDSKTAHPAHPSQPGHDTSDPNVSHGEPAWQQNPAYQQHDPILHLPRERDPASNPPAVALNQARNLPDTRHYPAPTPWLHNDDMIDPDAPDVVRHTIKVSVKKSRKAYKLL